MAASLLFAGCFGLFSPTISISIDPDPIQFTFADLTDGKEVTVNFETKGIGSITLEDLDLRLLDDSEEEVWAETIEIDEKILVVPGIAHDEPTTIELPNELQYAEETDYDSELKGKTYKLILTITGSMDDIVEEFDVDFE